MLKVYPYKERASHNDQTNMKSTSCQFAIGLDYGTNSVRAVIVDLADGTEVTNTVHDYPSGDEGVLLDPTDPNLARQNPADYIEGFYRSVGSAVRAAKKDRGFKPENVVGIGPEQMVVVDLDGNRVEGDLAPSSDTPTHVILYRSFPEIGGVTHTHSRFATAFAQARREIPCLGTTHADHFCGSVPVTRPLREDEVAGGYEANTGRVIVERLAGLDPVTMPAVLAAGHAPFTWGTTAQASVQNALALEAVAEMALWTGRIDPEAPELEDYVLRKHYERKHGPAAYYGQTAAPAPTGSYPS